MWEEANSIREKTDCDFRKADRETNKERDLA